MKRFKYALSSLLLCSLPTLSHADTCLPVGDLTQNHLQGWQAYDADNGTPLPPDRLAKYEHAVKKFALATWLPDALEGPAQCYYSNYKDPYYLNVYLAKYNLQADTSLPDWHATSMGYECAAGLNSCRFVPTHTAK